MMLHDRGELRIDFRPLPLTVTYHAPCHSRATGSASRRWTSCARARAAGTRTTRLLRRRRTYGLKTEK